MSEYNGWKNYETWNVALWIENDEGLYSEAKRYRHKGYKEFAKSLQELQGKIGHQTPDGVSWTDASLDLEALNKLLEEL